MAKHVEKGPGREAALLLLPALAQAARLKHLLANCGIEAELLRPPQCLGPHGCSFSLRLNSSQLQQALRVAKAGEVQVDALFQETAPGQYHPIDGVNGGGV